MKDKHGGIKYVLLVPVRDWLVSGDVFVTVT